MPLLSAQYSPMFFHHTQIKIHTPYHGPQGTTWSGYCHSFSLIIYHSPRISLAQAFLPFLKYVKSVLTSGFLHLVFPMPRRFFPQVFTRLAPSSHSGTFRCQQKHFLTIYLKQLPYSVPSHVLSLPCFSSIFFFLILTLYSCLPSINSIRS